MTELKKEKLDMSMDLKELNKIKLQLTESLLERMKQLKKTMDDIANLQKILSEKELEIASLQSLSTQDKEATHALKVRVRELEQGSKRNEHKIRDISRRGSNRELFEENQELLFEVNKLRPLNRYSRGDDPSRRR